MARSATLRETGLFDDGFFLYFDEVELMHRMKARGWVIRHVPDSRVIHAEGSSSGDMLPTAVPAPVDVLRVNRVLLPVMYMP